MRQAYLRSHEHQVASEVVVGHITVAMHTENKVTQVGLAYCAPHDQFSRVYGRTIAHERCLECQHKYSFCVTTHEDRHNDAIVDILVHALVTNAYPQWAKPLILQQLAIHATCAVNNKIFGG